MSKSPVESQSFHADHSQLYEILVSHLTDFAVFLMDQRGLVVSWNPGVERLLGYSEAEWLGEPVDLIFTPEDQLAGAPEKEIDTAVMTGRAPDTRWHLRKDGRRIFVEGTLVALRSEGGELLGFSKVMRDITERKVREEQLQDALQYAEGIVNTVSEPLLLLTSNEKVQYANLAFYQHFQVTQDQTEDHLLSELCNGCWNDPGLRSALEDLRLDPSAIASLELECNVPRLGNRALILKARRLWRQGKDSELILLAIEDVTERRRAEQARAESQRQLRVLMDTAPAIISYIDRNLRYRMANGAYERWFGLAPGDLIGKSVFEFFNAPLFSVIQPNIERALNGETVSFEENYPDRSGGFRTLHVTYTPDCDDAGRVQGFMVLGSDTSERTAAERALRTSEERWRSLFEVMSEGFFVGEIIYDETGSGSDFRFIEINPAFEKVTGVSGAAGKTVREAIPGIQDELIEAYARVVRTGEPAHFEVRIPALNDHWYEARARATEDDCFAVLFLDITERKNAEIQLQENLHRQAALVALGDRLRDLKDIPSLTSAAMEIVGKVLEVDRAGYGTVDTSQEYVTIANEWRSDRVASLAGTYRFSDFGRELGERLRNGETIRISDVSSDPITASENLHWKALEINALINLPLFENGRLATLLFIQTSSPRSWTDADLTFLRKVADRTWAAAERARALQELQESEEFNRSVLASTPDCVKVLDLNGALLTINQGGCDQMEIENLAARMNQPWSDVWGAARDTAEAAIAEARSGRTARFEGFCPTTKGTPKWWEVVVTPILDASGNPVRILVLSRDISERRTAEKERDRLTGELKRSNEELSQFAHFVAHDLQSPLRGVISFAQLLLRKAQGKLSSEEQAILNQIVDSGRRMHDFVQAILRFAQLGQGAIGSDPVEMDRVAENVLQFLQTQIQEQEARITRTALPRVRGDSTQLVQLLQNLISNALKYRRASEPPTVSIKAIRSGGEYLFSVEDNGEGIAPEHLDKIFEPLKRLHGTELPGTGLGLTICQRIANRHGGRIWVESRPGVGSIFYFTLQPA